METQRPGVLSAALQSAKVKDQQAKQRAKVYVDKRNRVRPSDIKSKVLLQQARQNKLSTMYDPNLYTVLDSKGPSLIQEREGRVFMPNVLLIEVKTLWFLNLTFYNWFVKNKMAVQKSSWSKNNAVIMHAQRNWPDSFLVLLIIPPP